MATFARKISAGLSVWFIGILLSLVGYDAKLAHSGVGQALSTQRGIAMIFIVIPVILVVLLLIFGYIFPITNKEFDVVKREIARRRGEDNSVATDDEKRVLERVTGFKYENLWKVSNEHKVK